MIAALTIASTDSCGGAGVLADLRVFNMMGIHGAAVVTTVTAQNTCGIWKIFPLPHSIVQAQLEAVLSDLKPRAIKTGMLYSPEIVNAVLKSIKDKHIPLIVDPVLRATTGATLHIRGHLTAIKKLSSIAELITPNAREAELLSGIKIKNKSDMFNAAEKIRKFGVKNVLVKGGHLHDKESIDYLYNGIEVTEFHSRREKTVLHGAGCAYSALITGHIAMGKSTPEAVRSAKSDISRGINRRYMIGRGDLEIPRFI